MLGGTGQDLLSDSGTYAFHSGSLTIDFTFPILPADETQFPNLSLTPC